MNGIRPIKKEIAILAGPGLVGALRLAGIGRARAIEATPEAAGEVRETLREWTAGNEVGLIVISQDLAAMAEDLILPRRKGKPLLPVILIIQSAGERGDPAEYYRRLSRDFLGMEIVLGQHEHTPESKTT